MDRFFGIYAPIFIASAFAGVFFLLRWMSGWARLASQYGYSGSFQGEIWRWKGGKMNGVTGPFHIGVNSDGFYLAQGFIFRIGHRPLFIPWHDISVVEKGNAFHEHIEFHFKKVPDITFEIPRRLGEIIAESAGPSWPAKVKGNGV